MNKADLIGKISVNAGLSKKDSEKALAVNGRPAKASYSVKVGDVLEIRFGQRLLRVEVTAVAENVPKADAAAMYREIV